MRVARGPALTRERPRRAGWGAAVIVGKGADLLSHSPKQLEPRQLSHCPHLGSQAWTGRTRLPQLVSQVDPNSHSLDSGVGGECQRHVWRERSFHILLGVSSGCPGEQSDAQQPVPARSCSNTSSEVRFAQAVNFGSP